VSHSGLPKLIDEHLPFENLEDAAMPVHILTTDIVSGNAVVLCEGSAREAITATTSTASRFGHRQIRVAFLGPQNRGARFFISQAINLRGALVTSSEVDEFKRSLTSKVHPSLR
jgi:hypothetical protein